MEIKKKRTKKTPVKKFYITLFFYSDDGLRAKIIKKHTMRFSNIDNAKKRWEELQYKPYTDLYSGIEAVTNLPLFQQCITIKRAWYL